MSKFPPLISITLCLATLSLSSAEQEYYWREYTGDIPEDAVVAGKDINGRNTYIGQAYIKNLGMMVVQIYPGKREVKAALHGVQKVDRNTKILCGIAKNFSWLKVTASSFSIITLNKNLVLGGHEDGHGPINIGRISSGGETKIGKVNAFITDSANFRFVDSNDGEPLVKSYEVLVYDDVA